MDYTVYFECDILILVPEAVPLGGNFIGIGCHFRARYWQPRAERWWRRHVGCDARRVSWYAITWWRCRGLQYLAVSPPSGQRLYKCTNVQNGGRSINTNDKSAVLCKPLQHRRLSPFLELGKSRGFALPPVDWTRVCLNETHRGGGGSTTRIWSR
jgi:hypothetical protein